MSLFFGYTACLAVSLATLCVLTKSDFRRNTQTSHTQTHPRVVRLHGCWAQTGLGSIHVHLFPAMNLAESPTPSDPLLPQQRCGGH